MREILFRGKRVDNGKWIEGFYGYKEDGQKHFIIKEELNVNISSYFVDIDIIPETVGQFTGLTNKNGVKIFDGDIVKTDSYAIQKVEYRSDIGMFVLRFSKGASINIMNDCEVIGNIHDNPELLK